ncbi:MAG: outer membrane lipoprotein chaperone LolA [Gemmatimonadales bacterium]
MRQLRTLAALLTLLQLPAAAQEASSVLRRAEDAYHELATIRAEFTQTITNPMLGDPEISSGVLFLVVPDRFAMRFTDPAGDRIVADREWLWIYTPSTVPNQVIKQPVPESGANTPNLFAQFVERATERYRAQYLGADQVMGDSVDAVHLTPLIANAWFDEATISISRDTGLLRKLEFTEESGQKRLLVLTAIQLDGNISDRELRFEVPNGARVVTP